MTEQRSLFLGVMRGETRLICRKRKGRCARCVATSFQALAWLRGSGGRVEIFV